MYMVKSEWNCTGWPWDRLLQNIIFLYANAVKCVMENALKIIIRVL